MKKNILISCFLLGFSIIGLAQKEMTGVIASVNGKTFTVKADATDPMPAKTDTCSISKDISGTKNPFGITISSGWMGIGNIMLTNVKGTTLTFKILKETSNITINGKKQPNFVAGKKVKIEWGGTK
jgi:hypothetical protein